MAVRRGVKAEVINRQATNASRWADRSKMIGICAICETQHELEFLESGVEEGTAWEDFLCPVTGETFTHLHSPTQLAPDAGDSAISTSLVHASAESTSQAEPMPTQRG